MQDFRNLRVWQAAHRVTLAIYRATAAFPREETFGLTSQLRRSISAVGANLAEGCGRGTPADTRRCFRIAFGEACESLNHLILARDLGYLEPTTFDDIERELRPIRRMLLRLMARMT